MPRKACFLHYIGPYIQMVWDSTTMQVRLSPARIELMLTAVMRVREGRSLTVKQFQKLLGLITAASNMIPFGLLYMRPLQRWLKTNGFSPRGNPLHMTTVMRQCLRALDMWRKPWFLSQCPVLGALCRRTTLATDASLIGWGAVMSGHPAPTVCGVVGISRGTSTACRCWPCFENSYTFLQT